MKLKIKSKKGLFGIVIIAIILGIMFAVCLINSKIAQSDKTIIEYLKQVINVSQFEKEKKEYQNDIEVVPTMLDSIGENSAWCPTFQLIWNDFENEVIKKEIVFEPQIKMVENLNKQEFTGDMLSDSSYFKTYGLKTLELKKEIENGIKEKFNEKSSVIDLIDWSENALSNEEIKKYIFYAMLKKEFNFEKEFLELENSTFGKEYDNIKYFGVKSDTSDAIKKQVEVWYYNSDTNFAVELHTKEGDSVILARGEKGNNFKEIYEEINKNKDKYKGDKFLGNVETFKVPYLSFDILREYTELENKKFLSKDNEIFEIEKSLQTIEFDLDNKGGKLKSEAIMEAESETAILVEEKPRKFDFDDEFVIFLKEEGKEIPYFAANISNITLFQK